MLYIYIYIYIYIYVESRDPAIFKVLPPVTRTSDVILQNINLEL